jgi:hypothetical protein
MLRTRNLLLVLALLSLPTLAWTHHSYAAVDMAKRSTVQGTVTTLEWTNPHVWLWIGVTDEKGASAPYGFESASPSELTRFFGWNKRVLTPGQPVTIEFAPFRNGDRGGALVAVTFADGRVLSGRRPYSGTERQGR